ncbi:hypothetical protein Gotur_009125 [Gossypium turneri]
MDRDQIRLTLSPFWMKIDPNFPEFDKKDLLHAIGASFGGVLRSEINEDFCRLRVNLDVQRPLRRGIFVSMDAVNKVWVPFKYENLPMFCFGYGRMGHGLSNCIQLPLERKSKISENPPFSIALKAESKLLGKEIKFNTLIKKKVGAQCSYTRGENVTQKSTVWCIGDNAKVEGSQDNGELLGEEMTEEEEGLLGIKEAKEAKTCLRQKSRIQYKDKTNWEITQLGVKTMTEEVENNVRKRKSFGSDLTCSHKENTDRVGIKRLKHDNSMEWDKGFLEEKVDNYEQPNFQDFLKSAAANRQADRMQ